MKYITQYMLLLLVMVAATSCKKFLDVTPKGYTIPKTVEDFDRILNGSDLIKYMPTDLDIMSDDHFLEGAERNPQESNRDNKAYIWHPFIYSTESDYQFNAPWTIVYRNIFQYNAVINNIDNATYGTDDQKKKIKGQAYFGRAWSYWQLINLYTKPYNAATAASDAGVPLVTGNDINAPLPGRGTVKESYDFIVADLAKAIDMMPASSLTKYRPVLLTAQALLARTYLFMNDYEKAKAAATQVLAVASTLNNYNTITEKKAPGVYKLINTQGFRSSTIEQNPEYLYINLYSYTFGMQGRKMSNELMSYLAPYDIRRMQLVEGDGRFTQSFFYYTNIGLTVPEMYLTRAEAYARTGQLTQALVDLNELRRNRIDAAAFVPLSSADQKQVTRWVLDERRREFFSKGMRWFDMRRLSSDKDFGFTASHYLADGTTVSLAPGSNRYMLALPATAVSETIPQNPR